MAIVELGRSQCAICREVLSSGHDLFAATKLSLPPSDPLLAYLEAAMHWDCYASWRHRRRFARAAAEAYVPDPGKETTPYHASVWADDDVRVSVAPEWVRDDGTRSGGAACVALTEVGTFLEVDLRNWRRWVYTPPSWIARHPVEAEALARVQPRLADRFRSKAALLMGIDCVTFVQRCRAHDAAEKEKERYLEERRRQTWGRYVAEHNAELRGIHRRLLAEGFTCPRCHRPSHEPKLEEGSETKKSAVVCRRCGAQLDRGYFG
ncbi:MAG TPA: hypothetical protein VKB80_35480 [Kofleriaceae bacterium]|nr:hypothetical protein [Kofleriaceae bacterium]